MMKKSITNESGTKPIGRFWLTQQRSPIRFSVSLIITLSTLLPWSNWWSGGDLNELDLTPIHTMIYGDFLIVFPECFVLSVGARRVFGRSTTRGMKSMTPCPFSDHTCQKTTNGYLSRTKNTWNLSHCEYHLEYHRRF